MLFLISVLKSTQKGQKIKQFHKFCFVVLLML